jgi:hypothetical protein
MPTTKTAKIVEVMMDPEDSNKILVQFDPATPVPMDGGYVTEVCLHIPNFSPSGLRWFKAECLKNPQVKLTEPLTKKASGRRSVEGVIFDRFKFLDALHHSGKQRPCSANQAQKYAKEMVDGHWGRCADRFMFQDGWMRNGLTRSVSGFVTGITVTFDVLLEASDEEILNADRGKSRTNDQNAEITGLTAFDPTTMPTYAVTRTAIYQIFFEGTGSTVQSPQDYAKAFQAFDWNLRRLGRFYRNRHMNRSLIARSPVLTAILLAHKLHPEEIELAVEAIVSNQIAGTTLDPQGYGEKHALQRLVAYLVNTMRDEGAKTKEDNRKRREKGDLLGPSEQSRITYKVLHALDSYLRGKPISKHNALEPSPDMVTKFYPKKTMMFDPLLGVV